ncbi:hypothetical protein Lesp02_70180 [Lentzea sp. NBRC 105346]|uniref:hypothetical protein n=1 Tax=Lentzea sp. NBRC 105346 TaxID=3032205 RepID=UPI0024A164BC|nr:hypothetical protein [Lentzea sp. NBRC 105346]GLZ34831.1 hypothetical protein Lesp02_70180 [Lentzea sp. NBRC 105346]
MTRTALGSRTAVDVALYSDVSDLRHRLCRLIEDTSRLASWFDELRDDTVAVASRSYWHPNGFAKIVLDPAQRVRLHVWPESNAPRLGESNPHSHRWDFASTVLTGEGLHTVEYAESSGGMSYHRYHYGADPNDRARLVADAPVELTAVRSPFIRRGQIYTCDTSVIHTVRPAGDALTATLVLQGPQKTSTTAVYLMPGTSEDQPNGVLTPDDFLALSGAVLERMGVAP